MPKPAKRRIASIARRRSHRRGRVVRRVSQLMIGGANVRAAKTFEKKRILQSSQYPPVPQSLSRTNPASTNEETNGASSPAHTQKMPVLRKLSKRTGPPVK